MSISVGSIQPYIDKSMAVDRQCKWQPAMIIRLKIVFGPLVKPKTLIIRAKEFFIGFINSAKRCFE